MSYPMSYMIAYCIFDILISYPISCLISCVISYTIFLQAGLVPPLDEEAEGIITSSESILKEFTLMHSLNASTILSKTFYKLLLSIRIKLNTYMLQRLQASGVTFRL